MTALQPSTVMVESGTTVWLTGLPSAGKTTIAKEAADRLRRMGRRVEVLDGDELRTHLTADLGFDRADRDENVRRVGYVADLLSRNGVVVLCSLVSPFREARDDVRRRHAGRFIEVYVATPLAVCSERDVKGLYARQRTGAMSGLTGVDDDYEPPVAPEVVVHTHRQSLDDCVDAVLRAVQLRVGGGEG